jgi:hypothetical protein
MSFTYTQSGPNPVGTLNLNTAHLKLTYQDKKLIFFNNVSLGGSGSNIIASNAVQAPGFQFDNTSANGIVYASNGVMATAGSGFSISGNTLTVPNLTVSGNLQVNGTVTTVNTTTLVITDPIVQIGSNVTDTTNVGLIFTSGPSFANVAFGFTPASNTMILTGTASSAYGTGMDLTSQVNFEVNGRLTANAFIGDGGLLSNISAVTTSNLQDVTTNGNVTTDYVTLGGLTTTDGCINGVSIQSTAGNTVNSSIAIGYHSASYNAGQNSTSIGNEAGAIDAGQGATALGYYAGNSGQGSYATALGFLAGETSQDDYAVAIGNYSGNFSQGSRAVAIGNYAGQSSQGRASVAIGDNAASDNQGSHAVSIGNQSGQTAQDYAATAIGNYAGHHSQGYEATAIGDKCGTSHQGSRAVAIGHRVGYSSQGSSAVAIGAYAAQSNQGSAAVAIGLDAGQNDQGLNAIAIGAYAGQTSQAANSIVLNASGVALDTSNTGFYVNPVRYVAGGSSNVLGYNTTTGEIFDTGSAGGGGSQTLQQVMDLGANSNVTMNLTNATTGLSVSSNVIIGGSIEMPGGNMNAYSVSLMSAAVDTLNANQMNAGILGLTGNLSAHANVVVDQGLSAQTVSANVVTANTFVGSGAGLTNVITASTLQQVTNNGATSNNTVTLTNATTGLVVSSNATIGGNLEMAAGNMNVYSVSTTSVAADVVNVTEVQATSVASVGATIYGTTTSEKVVSNVVTSNVLISENILTTDASVTGDLTVDGVTTVQILKFTPYSGIDPDTGNASVIASATGNTVTVNAAGVVYGSNVINLSGYTSPIRAFTLNVDVNAQIYLFASNVSVNTVSTPTVKYTNPTPITNSNVLFHVTTIAYAGFSVVNAIVVN